VAFVQPKAFTAGLIGAGGVPATVDHRADSTEGPVKSQGAVGTCTAVSLSTAMEHALRRMGVAEPVSALHIWSQYRVPKMGTAGDSTLDKKITAEVSWPYDPAQACKMMRRSYDSCGAAYSVSPNTGDSDPQIQAQKTAADKAGRYQLIGIEKLPKHDPNEFAAIIAGGEDLWVAFNINRAAWKNSGMTNNVIPDYSQTQATGHAVVLAGYRTVGNQKQFLIHNSWSTNWGENGYAWISENMVANQLRYAYRVRVANPAGGISPPGTTPGSGGCPSGQVKDSVYQQCVPACANGGVPAAGLCIPGLPGFPGSSPPGPGPQPQPPASGGCPQGQAKDVMTGQCAALCAGGLPAIGGMCLPRIQ